jgi:hypothetical protein
MATTTVLVTALGSAGATAVEMIRSPHPSASGAVASSPPPVQPQQFLGPSTTQVGAVGLPTPRTGEALAYDPASNRVVLQGGVGTDAPVTMSSAARPPLADSWTWDGLRWSPVVTITPPGRAGAGVARDPSNGLLIMAGGYEASSDPSRVAVSETWRWDGFLWTRLEARHSPPQAVTRLVADERRGTVLCYDMHLAPSGVTVSETWLWDGRDWTRPSGVLTPSRLGPPAYDTFSGDVIALAPDAFAGTATWAWNGHRWRQLTTRHVPPDGGVSLLAADGGHGGILDVVADGADPVQTWHWDGHDWNRLYPVSTPRSPFRMVTVPGAVVLFDDPHERLSLAAAWMWNGRTWVHLGVTNSS